MNNSLGYCCINLSRPELKTSRGIKRKTFESRGLDYVSQLTQQNLTDLLKVLHWNIENNILVYRMGSDMFPWFTEYELEKLPDFDKIQSQLKDVGEYILKTGMRVSFHPGPFNILNSLKPNVVAKTLFELSQHSKIMDLMGLECTRQYPINIHINSAQPTREEALKRFIKCIEDNKSRYTFFDRLTIENDDKGSLFCINDLYRVYEMVGTSIVFDNLHYKCMHSDMQVEAYRDAMMRAFSTWQYKPVMHWSSSKKLHEDPTAKSTAHSDYIYERIDTFGTAVDIEIEAKKKDLALLKYRTDFI